MNKNINELMKKQDIRVYKINYNQLVDMILKSEKNWLNSTTKIKINDLILTAKKRFTKYKSPESNKQFCTLYNSPNIIFKNKLMEMIYLFIGMKKIEEIEKLLKECKDDKVIIDFIKKNVDRKSQERFKVNKLHRMAINILKYTRQFTHEPRILDIGMGDGKSIEKISKLIKIKPYGADIKGWGPYKNMKKKVKFPFEYIQLKPYKIPFKSNYFDCIILSLVLHHAEDIGKVIDECYRLLKKNGIILIVEHDVWNDYDNMVINLQHILYGELYDEKIEKTGSYYNIYEWDYIFSKHGFVPLFKEKLLSDYMYGQGIHLKYDEQFIGIYKKSEKK